MTAGQLWVVLKTCVAVGEIDLEMLSQLRLKHPGVMVDNEVVEPSAQQLRSYRGSPFFIDAHYLHSANVNSTSSLLLSAQISRKCFNPITHRKHVQTRDWSH